MRCPKCGYISFDRQRSCGRCSNDLTAVAEQLQGTVGKAAAPFFLGAILGEQAPADAEPAPVPYEAEETFTLDEQDAEAPPADENDLDFAGAPLGEDDMEDQALPSLGLEDLDVSDLMSPQEEEEEPVLSLDGEQKEMLQGIEFPGFASDATLNFEEKEQALDGFTEGTATPPADAEEDEIIDLSSLMSFDEPPAKPADREEDHDILELSLEEDMAAPAQDDKPKKPATAMADIPDLDLTLENDDQ
ncbi:MAG: hypothetical protein ACYC2W_11930 [Desulfurivibrionaceae bacterium]